ncbi:MAG: hypothetical protein Kow00105_14300 [Phycisphaeraceae bacterium]
MSQPTRRDVLKSAAMGAIAAGLGAGVGAQGAAAESGNETTTSVGRVDRRVLGKIGKPVSILGLGLGSAFTKPYESDRDTGLKLLDEALKRGVNYFDTARAYGESESIIGPFVEKHRESIFLVSKSGYRDYDGFMREFETSLKNLRTDHIDLYHLHNFKPGQDDDLRAIENGAVRAARKLKEQGAIGAFGVTGHSGAQILMDAIKLFDPDAVLTIYPADRPDNGRYEDELLPLAREKHMGVIAMKTVRQARESDLKGSDLVRYALSLDGVHTAIVGLDTLAHLEENTRMATGFTPLDASARSEMSRAVRLALAGQQPPWARAGYDDHRTMWA